MFCRPFLVILCALWRWSQDSLKIKKPAAIRFRSLCSNKNEATLVILSLLWHNPFVHAYVIINVERYPSKGHRRLRGRPDRLYFIFTLLLLQFKSCVEFALHVEVRSPDAQILNLYSLKKKNVLTQHTLFSIHLCFCFPEHGESWNRTVRPAETAPWVLPRMNNGTRRQVEAPR